MATTPARRRSSTPSTDPVRGAWAVRAAAVLGLVHAAASTYWGLGGRALLETLGTQMVDAFRGREWLLLPIAALKALVAVGPLVVLAGAKAMSSRLIRITRGASWLVAITLMAWGALGMAVANLVLWGVISPYGGYDRAGMIGHAWLWDPLFAAWGLMLAMGLGRSRPR